MADDQGSKSLDFNVIASQTLSLLQQYNILRKQSSLATVSIEDPEFIKFCEMNKFSFASLSSHRRSDPSSTLSMIESRSKLVVASMMSSGGGGGGSISSNRVVKAVDHKSLPQSSDVAKVNLLLTGEICFEDEGSMKTMLSGLPGLDRKVIDKMSTSDFAFVSLDSGSEILSVNSTLSQVKLYEMLV